MPIYEYKAKDAAASCPHCANGFEHLQPVSSPLLAECPGCGAPVEKQISAPSIGGSKSALDSRAREAGFHKLERRGKGEYEKKY